MAKFSNSFLLVAVMGHGVEAVKSGATKDTLRCNRKRREQTMRDASAICRISLIGLVIFALTVACEASAQQHVPAKTLSPEQAEALRKELKSAADAIKQALPSEQETNELIKTSRELEDTSSKMGNDLSKMLQDIKAACLADDKCKKDMENDPVGRQQMDEAEKKVEDFLEANRQQKRN